MRKTYTNTNSGSTGGVGILTVVQIILIVLKLVGTINWPWCTVLIPLWIQIGILVTVGLLWLLVIAFHKRRKK